MERTAHLPAGDLARILDEDGVIRALRPVAEGTSPPAMWIGPGLIDMQVNGYNGISFSDVTTTVTDVVAVTERLWQNGVTRYLPTVVTSNAAAMASALAVIRKAAARPETKGSIVGVHLEGPFISDADGPRGAHPLEFVQDPDWSLFKRWQNAAGGLVRLVTLAPERQGALAFIDRLVAHGIVPAIGHTGADRETVLEAVKRGARFSTHLGNGAHARIRRHPNYIWTQLACDELMAGVIVDGHHLPPEVVKTYFRCKSVDRLILTTDASSVAGLPPGVYKFLGQTVEMTPAGKVCLVGTDYLAGSAVAAHTALGNVVRFSDATLADAFQMSALNPARLLGLDHRFGSLEVGKEADYVRFAWDPAAGIMSPVETVIHGETVWKMVEEESV